METKIIKITDLEQQGCDISYAADVIKKGGLVIFPTETVYGLGADATNPKAALSVYTAKGRPSDNPLIIHLAAAEDVEQYAYSNSTYYLLAEKFMPGPLTVVLSAKESIPTQTRGGLQTVAVRCPEAAIARALIKESGVPIAAPSANLSGSPSPTNANHVIDDMMGRVDVILDGGDCDFGLESTIVKIDGEKSVTLLRPGKITPSDIEALGITVNIAQAVENELTENEIALSPGMKYKHYAPKAPLVLLDASIDDSIKFAKNNEAENIAIISYTDDIDYWRSAFPSADIYDFGSSNNQLQQAHRLFKILRDTDYKKYNIIYAPLPSSKGIGLALYNRMIRAAAHKIIRL